jgi:aminomethyltransferase
MMMTQIDPLIYAAAHNTAVITDRSDLGLLKISGETRIDLIHRMSTQALTQLQAGEGAATILTTDIGRMIDRLILYAGSDTVYVLTGENNGDAVARYLMRFVFFNDDFQLQDISADTAVFGVYGPLAMQLLGEITGFPDVDIPLHHWREAEINGLDAYLHRTDPINGDGCFIMCEMAHRDPLWQALTAGGLIVADAPAFDYLRIEAGLPRFGSEITPDYIPLEAGLWSDVSFNKGCYTGQEIIARMESRGQLAKKLVQLRAAGSLSPGVDITANGKVVGSVTSSADGPTNTAALGYIKTAVLQTDATFAAAGQTVELYSE